MKALIIILAAASPVMAHCHNIEHGFDHVADIAVVVCLLIAIAVPAMLKARR
jgi:hypothetical protein